MQFVRSEQWDGSSCLALSAVQQAQCRLRHSDGGLGIKSMQQHAAAAFLGRTCAVLQHLARDLPQQQHPLVRNRILQSRTLLDVRDALQHLLQMGVHRDRITETVPAYWLAWADGDGSALLDALFTAGEASAFADRAATPERLQAKLSDLVDNIAAERMQELVNELPDPDDDPQRRLLLARWHAGALQRQRAAQRGRQRCPVLRAISLWEGLSLGRP